MMDWKELIKLYNDINKLRMEALRQDPIDIKRVIELDKAHKSVLEYKVSWLKNELKRRAS